MSSWTVEIFPEGMDSHSIPEYFSTLTEKDIALLLHLIEQLEELGPDIQGTNMDKLITGSIRELRKDSHRILYGREGRNFTLLVAFRKDSRKTPERFITLALGRFEEYKTAKRAEKVKKMVRK